ncbi:MAG: flagellar hook assembly protein FlgD [Deltaproteobacteria bacterium]|nr:flagellar hook assembly protein FlgD [Deltaproteobacteria bacterium]
MEVQQVNHQISSGQNRGTNARETVTQDEFLKLLTTQLQHQDPLNPMDNQEFTAQLATFNSLDQLININDKLDAMKAEQLALSRLQATFLIGKEVSARGNSVSLGEGGKATMPYTLAAEATRVVVNIKDGEGNLVRTVEVGDQKAGEQTVEWDGKDSTGKSREPGVYTFEVNAFDASGKTVAATTSVRGVVTGVDMAGSEPLLLVGSLKVPMSAVTSVGEAKS